MTPAAELSTVDSDTTVSALLDRMLSSRQLGYPVVEDTGSVGIVTLDDIQSTDLTEGVVATVMTPRAELQTVSPSTAVMDAFEMLGENNIGRLPVVDEHGSLCGIVTRTDLMRSFRVVTQQRRFDRGDLATAETLQDSQEFTR